jgi:hypothetical protein
MVGMQLGGDGKRIVRGTHHHLIHPKKDLGSGGLRKSRRDHVAPGADGKLAAAVAVVAEAAEVVLASAAVRGAFCVPSHALKAPPVPAPLVPSIPEDAANAEPGVVGIVALRFGSEGIHLGRDDGGSAVQKSRTEVMASRSMVRMKTWRRECFVVSVGSRKQ